MKAIFLLFCFFRFNKSLLKPQNESRTLPIIFESWQSLPVCNFCKRVMIVPIQHTVRRDISLAHVKTTLMNSVNVKVKVISYKLCLIVLSLSHCCQFSFEKDLLGSKRQVTNFVLQQCVYCVHSDNAFSSYTATASGKYQRVRLRKKVAP